MRIIYISHWRFPSEKTMSPLIMKTCEGLARKGLGVELWVPWRQNRGFLQLDPFLHHGVERNFVIRRLPSLDLTGIFHGNLFFILMVATFNLSLFLYALFRVLGDDVVFYFHDVRDAALLKFWGRPMFLEIHDFYKSGRSQVNNWVFSAISGFIVTNRLKMKKLHQDFRVTEERMLHQPNAVDVGMFRIDVSREEARRSLNLPENSTIILYTGHLFDWKGVDTLFDAHQFLGEDEVVYFVGGTDEDIKNFRLKTLNLKSNNIIIVGRRPHKEIPLWQRAADVLVLPNSAKFPESKYETSPVKLFEYMASGRPIAASDLPSIRDIVDEELVFFFEPDNARSIADTVRYIEEHQEEAKKRGLAAQKEVEKYSWERRSDNIFNFMLSRL
ncbi:MAG: glycosyltransferase family 4 protein [Candidatus Sungiibacteriota bacterium]|uniref:Glycosyltransferase family 4 protein n=1 Tax=Candidatus Sungiibacteriota bacterium TaxID=2750080 RepID=A0A7T5RJV0_9BACT|nr:MAG: glycosyltransferase family 4 protein [Candidatus Sungbacteria bacterium]